MASSTDLDPARDDAQRAQQQVFERARTAHREGQLDLADAHYRQIPASSPFHADAVLNRGRLLDTLGRAQEAIACYREAACAAPRHPVPLILLGAALNRAQRYDEAVRCFEHATALQPGNVDALFGLAYACDGQRNFDRALTVYRAALALQPDSAALHNNLAYTLTCMARYDEAKPHYLRAIALAPTLSEAHHQLAMITLRDGDFRAGWPGFEHRRSTRLGTHDHVTLHAPEWRGEPLAGRRILLTREQGAGDQIQFVRYAASLAARGATVDVWPSPELAALFARANGVRRVLTDAPVEQYDYWCPLMSVPGRLDDPAIPAAPYLRADDDATRTVRAHLASLAAPFAAPRTKIGLVWAGNPRHHLDAFRSLPLAALLPLADVPDVAWFALQQGIAQHQLDALRSQWTIHPPGAELRDFDATAAVITALDLVITVDTSVAHLAGALGRPVWVLLPVQSDWRWMHTRDDSPWYPTARLFRQTRSGDWSGVVAAVRAALLDRVARNAAGHRVS